MSSVPVGAPAVSFQLEATQGLVVARHLGLGVVERGVAAEDEAEELDQGALDPDEVDDPEWWDEGVDDEVD